MRCRLFHRAYWRTRYVNMYGGTNQCTYCGRVWHFGGIF